MARADRVSLLDARPELTRSLTPGELEDIARVHLPVVTADPSRVSLDALLAEHHAFGAAILDGVVMTSLRVGEQTGVQVLGPGDVVFPGAELFPTWARDFESRTAGSVRLALLGNEFLAATVRWPRIVQGLFACVGEQLQRMTAQLVICQLPRVDERVLAILWLLSESWGHVTPSGVRLPLVLTHETLGALVGARRPTVTLALRKLVEDGAIVHQDAGWLLLEPPAEPEEPAARILAPEVEELLSTSWAELKAQDRTAKYAEIRDTVRRLREQHASDRQASRDQLNQIRSARVRMSAVRQRIEEESLRRRWPPSS
jgi:CRP/FNR family transcriptional regulator, cyclic AMP receptor protein